MIAWAKKIVLITAPVFLATAVVVAAGIEVWVRLRWNPNNGQPGLFLSDAVLGQRLAPNYDGWFAGVPVHINNLGFRNPRDFTAAKPATAFRIVFLGDSVTFGHGSIYEHTYPYLFEQKLRAWRPDVDWQVWNLAVPGYNTTQELDHLKEIGPRFSPDLVIVGFYDNDLVDNHPPRTPGVLRVAATHALSFAQRHVYSIELYKRIYLQMAWRLSASDKYRERLENINAEEDQIRKSDTLADAPEQKFSEFEHLTDEQAKAACPKESRTSTEVVDAAQRQPGYRWWVEAVRQFQRLNREGRYRIVFFLNVAPPKCEDKADPDWFLDDDGHGFNALITRVVSDGTMPVVSTHDALLHTRPSQMPGWSGHSLGNTNALKADVLFSYLRDRGLLEATPPRTQTSAAGR